MKGIPQVKVVVARNNLQTAFDMYDPCTRTRIAVHMDCTPQGSTVRTDLRSPVYGARAYRVRVAPGQIDVSDLSGQSVQYPRCAGWSEGFSSPQH
ncbi:hypothetical protein [Paraburkholderia sp. C35]|uniref:hypothetical protein n=1 Tax=Paraburkholderia sp. C35 TaxID=2126993 RepID=UPI000D6973C8|nr:hypothetical protein [Paraburkholderia sp. C35]